MNNIINTLEFNKIIDKLKEYTLTKAGKDKLDQLKPILSERELKHELHETTEARIILDKLGLPPLISLEQMHDILITANQGGCLTPEQLEYVVLVLNSVRRLKDFLNRGKQLEVSLPYYEGQLKDLEYISNEINEKIRGSKVDDFASKTLKNLRQEIERIDNKMRTKADSILKNNKECFSDSFVTTRNGRICLPVKKDFRFKISGSVIEKSSTGATLFVEPTGVGAMYDELINLKLDAENEERRILYLLTEMVIEEKDAFEENIRIIEKLDYIFAKGKLSYDMDGVEPTICTHREIKIVKGRHPFIDGEKCVPLDFQIGGEVHGVIITGPNTGGKTVAIKTVGLLSIMAQSGLHVPCEEGVFTMNSQVLCDIGDGQNITENLSTFSAHITNVLDILKHLNEQTLVIMDELGSGTDPTEGMGIAIAVLEELNKSKCFFVVTTHYPEIKTYAQITNHIINARMAFNRETLRPLYRLEIGEAGESCALYIAKELGMPSSMLKRAALAAYDTEELDFIYDVEKEMVDRVSTPKILKEKQGKKGKELTSVFQIGDSVMILPDKKIGIVCKPINEEGVLQVQLKGKKIWINHKRVKLQVRATELYPEDYDFSIVFDSVEVRKARHNMSRKYSPEIQINMDKEE